MGELHPTEKRPFLSNKAAEIVGEEISPGLDLFYSSIYSH
jgi:hypothetical protein